MNNSENTNLYFGGMIVFLVVAVILILFFLKELKAPLMYAKWCWNSKNHTRLEVDIIESKIVEMPFKTSGTGRNRSSSTISLYCPIVVCSFTFKSIRYSMDVNLHRRGFKTPEAAINALYNVTNGGDFTFIHMYRSTIRSDFADYLLNFRTKTNNTSNKMSLIINSKNPKENEYQYRGARMTDFIAPAILLFFVLVVLLTPLVYFSSLNVSARILSALVTILVSLLIYYVALPYAKKSILLLLNGDTDEIVETKKFEVKIDKHYNGTQLKPYFSKD